MKYMRYTTLLLWIIMSRPAMAQLSNPTAHTLDSLKIELSKAPDDIKKAKLLSAISNYWGEKEAKQSLVYAIQSLELAEKTKNRTAIGLALLSKGNAFFNLQLPDSAEKQFRYALELLRTSKEKEDIKCLARVWTNYGIFFQLKNKNDKYLDILLHKVVPLAEQVQDSSLMGQACETIGLLFINEGQYDKAQQYLAAASGVYRKHLTYDMLAQIYLYMARAALFKLLYSSGNATDLLHLKQAVDTARIFLGKDTSSRVWVNYYAMEGGYYYFKPDYRRALQSFDSGWVLEQKWHTGYNAAILLQGKAEVYYKMKQPELAKQMMYATADYTKRYRLNMDQLLLLRKIAALEAETHNYPVAYQKLWDYVLLSDSANITKMKIAVADLEGKYQNEKKENEIRQLQGTNKLNRYLAYLFITAIALLSVLLLLAYSRYRSKKRSAAQQAALLEQKLQQQMQEQRIEVANALLEGEERERRRLASDLHDGLGGMLANVKINLSDIVYQTAGNNLGLDKAIRQLDQSVTELRRIARNMMPESLMRSGLEAALADLCSASSSGNIKVDFQMINIPAVQPGQTQVIIYRIVQELLANVLRHSGASEVFVQCSQSDPYFHITVEDNGRGLDTAALKSKSGIGIENVRNRVDFLQGKLDIESASGKGTTINIELYVA